MDHNSEKCNCADSLCATKNAHTKTLTRYYWSVTGNRDSVFGNRSLACAEFSSDGSVQRLI